MTVPIFIVFYNRSYACLCLILKPYLQASCAQISSQFSASLSCLYLGLVESERARWNYLSHSDLPAMSRTRKVVLLTPFNRSFLNTEERLNTQKSISSKTFMTVFDILL